jgi:hypothetical protein
MNEVQINLQSSKILQFLPTLIAAAKSELAMLQ